MFNPAELTLVHRDDRPYEPGLGSFVGIRRTEDGGRAFHLPYGFDAFPADDADAVNRMFFSLFKALRHFQRASGWTLSSERDGSVSREGGFEIVSDIDEPATLYSQIPMLEAILDSYDELRIFVLVQRQRRTERVDYSHLHRYLHEAVYLEGDVAYVDEMILPRPALELTVTDLVQMFCFIYAEIKGALEEPATPEVEAQAHIFKAKHLYPDSLLFRDVERHAHTIRLLKDKLYEIDRQMGYKDADYWHFFGAVDAFLYGDLEPSEDGTYWGVTRFSPVWEDMCLVWVWRNAREGVLYADTPRYGNTNLGGHRVYVQPDFDFPFYFELNGEKRYMRPDLVRHSIAESQGEGAEKYVRQVLHAEWQSETTCIVQVTERSELARKCFRGLAKKLHRTGFRKSYTDWKGTFHMVTPDQYNSAVTAVAARLHGGKRTEEGWRVVDFKCVSLNTYGRERRLGRKASMDVRKQITYEYSLQLQEKAPTRSELCLPYFFSERRDDILEEVDDARLHDDLREQGIVVQLVDFVQVQEAYLEEAQEETDDTAS